MACNTATEPKLWWWCQGVFPSWKVGFDGDGCFHTIKKLEPSAGVRLDPGQWRVKPALIDTATCAEQPLDLQPVSS
jgi:hypothetical protein